MSDSDRDERVRRREADVLGGGPRVPPLAVEDFSAEAHQILANMVSAASDATGRERVTHVPFGLDLERFGPAPLAGGGTASGAERIRWYGTLRPRIGYAFNRTLLYVTGGRTSRGMCTSSS